jgi:hypothetical protein
LLQENGQLRAGLERVKEWLVQEERITAEVARYQAIEGRAGDSPFFARRAHALKEGLELQMRSLPAQVVFREPTSWSSACWINVGKRDNVRLDAPLVCKNSPVLSQGSVVGIVEEVGERRSRVRLITDASLVLSVRALRGGEQYRHLLTHVNFLLDALEGAQPLTSQLTVLKAQLIQEGATLHLAKGELRGSSVALWRSRGAVLKGVGFNYDFADNEGAARDLRSGIPYGSIAHESPLRLIQEGDLLVTTGFDGYFPPGLKVATVSRLGPLKEGASAYTLEALPTAGDLDDLSCLFVLPPLK